MSNKELSHNMPSYNDLVETNSPKQNVIWNHRFNTKLAHPSGRIPSLSTAVGWQPVFAPGTARISIPLSPSIRGLVKRIRVARGEVL